MPSTPDSDPDLPSATPTGNGYPVAPAAGDDDHNAIHVETQSLQIVPLDHAGQIMGADPDSDDPVDQAKGVFYQLILESGDVRFGHADADGVITEEGLEAVRSATLRWGEPDDELRPQFEEDDETWADYFLYEQKVVFECAPWEDGGDMGRRLANLGYGEEDDPRAAFGADYGASDDATIADVHDDGKPRPTSG